MVQADDNHIKWIWAVESQPELRDLGRALRGSGVLSQIGIAVEEDTVPSNKQSKIVSKLMDERRAGQKGKTKKGKNEFLGIQLKWIPSQCGSFMYT